MAEDKHKDYVPPRLSTAKRFSEIQAKANAATKPAAKPAPKDDKADRIKARAKSMDDLSFEALMKRAGQAAGD